MSESPAGSGDVDGPSFERPCSIRFGHCDPSGIIFFPQYFVLFNGLVEDWFADALGLPFSELIERRRIGVPTVHLQTDFRAVSRMGDSVRLVLQVAALGTRSLTLDLACWGEPGGPGEPAPLRVRSRHVLVATSLETHRAIVIPPDLRAAIERFTGRVPDPGR